MQRSGFRWYLNKYLHDRNISLRGHVILTEFTKHNTLGSGLGQAQ